jgi:hypothetical protein
VKHHLLALAVLAAVAGCSDTDSNTTQATTPDPNPQIDTDPTPQTGTGGEQQNAAPDGTVNGAPGAAPMKDQGTPTD